MKILFLSYYFQPDLCAGSFRNTALIAALKGKVPEGSQIDVITTLPTRYSSFNVDAPKFEVFDGGKITRVELPAHENGMFDQSKAFITYARQVISLSGSEQYDLVYASSSRLMTAFLGALLANKQSTPLYLDIRDIFVDTIKDVLSPKLTWLLKPAFSMIESWTFRKAKKVNLVSEGFKDYFKSRYPQLHYSFYTNGIDDEFVNAQPDSCNAPDSDVPNVVYAGNIGEGQGLHAILPSLAQHFQGRLNFKVVGDGGRKRQLEEAIRDKGVGNIQLYSPVSRGELIKIYKDADILFLHLNDYDAFLKVLPSKIFEYAALGKPVWAGVSGYSAKFLEEYVSNAVVFHPCSLDEAIKSFDSLNLETCPRTEFVENFSRSKIMEEMASDIVSNRA